MIDWIKSIAQKTGAYWNEVLSDIDGFKSSKRVGYLISCAVVVGSWVANVFWHIVVDAHILTAALGLGGVAGAGIAGERFGKARQASSNVVPPPGG